MIPENLERGSSKGRKENKPERGSCEWVALEARALAAAHSGTKSPLELRELRGKKKDIEKN